MYSLKENGLLEQEKCDFNALFVFFPRPLCVLKGLNAEWLEKETNAQETVTVH